MSVNAKKMRVLPLAYAAADSAYDPSKSTPPGTSGKVIEANDYAVIKIQGLLCGDKMVDGVMQQSIDIFLINEYRWCNDATFAAYQQFMTLAKGVPIVMALGEFGCVKSPPRKWEMVPYLFSDSTSSKGFTDIFSGGLAYSFGDASLSPGSGYPLFTGIMIVELYIVHVE